MDIVLDVIAGIMGPVIFVSLTTSIIAFNSIEEFTDIGFKVFKRFVVIALFLMAIALGVSAVFFVGFGDASVSIVPNQIIERLLNIIPTNVILPFADNNTPQLVVLGLVFGVTLLMLGNRVKELDDLFMQLNECLMGVMSLTLTIVPVIPFLSLMINIADGNLMEILSGWKYIVACYVAFTIAIVLKALKTSGVSKIGISDLWNKMKPAIKITFSTGSTDAATKLAYEISEKEFNIQPEFTSFWIPMCSAMLSPKTTICLVLATCMAAQATGLMISESFILVMALVTLELSLANPGLTSSIVIMFETLGMPMSYVGLFSAYRLLTENYVSAVVEAYCILEEVEAAHKLNKVNPVAEA